MAARFQAMRNFATSEPVSSEEGRPLEWVILFAYLVVSYLITVSGIKVYNLCKYDEEENTGDPNFEEKGGGNSTSMGGIICTSLMIPLIIAVMVMGKDGLRDGLSGVVQDSFWKGISIPAHPGIKAAKLGIPIVLSILLLLSVAFTSVAVFMAKETEEACDTTMIQSEEDRETFEHHEEIIITLRGFMILILIVVGSYLLFSGGKWIRNAWNNRNTSSAQSSDEQVGQVLFGRNIKKRRKRR